ncbi:MAG: cytochrome C oxidase subunit IV family protein [Vicingaceae bacterium]|nr:cytochrome C oxidase subunit IV family protein [Vicingaceae bacterium]
MEHSDQPYKYAQHHSEAEGKKTRRMVWNMFWVLLAITSIEVGLGLIWQDWGIPFHLVKMTFIVMTLVKAYFIVAYYMHLKHEKSFLKNSIIIPYVLLALYLIYMVITEGTYTTFMEYLW